MNSKSLLIFIIFFILFFACSKKNEENRNRVTVNDQTAKVQETIENVGIIAKKTGLNFRTGPFVFSKSMKIIKHGEIVQIIEIKYPSEKIGGIYGNWTRIRSEGVEGWIFTAFEFFPKTVSEEHALYVSKFEGLEVYESPVPNSKVISKTKFGDRVRILTKSFAINDRPPPWNIIRVNGKKGFIKADYLSVNFHTKEEIDKAPWIGMEYSGEIENCKPGSGSIPKNSGMPEGKAFVIFPMTCRGKSFIVFEERTGIVNEFGVFKTLFVLDRDMFPSGPNSASLITSHSETNTDISCYTQKKIQIPIAFVNLQKGKSQTDANQNTIYTNAIEKAWLYDSDLNTLVPKNVPDGYCFEPHISKNKS